MGKSAKKQAAAKPSGKAAKDKATKSKPDKAKTEKAKMGKMGKTKAGKTQAAQASPARRAAPATAPIMPPLALGASSAVLDRLWAVVTSRRDADPAISHSARLLSRGTAKVAQKFGEEAVECLIEATLGDRVALVGESADVLYHLIVLWVDAGIRPDAVWAELQRREGVSGIAEKAARPRQLPAALRIGTRKIP
ncbi:MAG: phosphoribosyl-ATP diphosphatase [Rhodospirillales bacterium]|nr:phosphoribosyl-ATP diphosphatase [Rhodospirillales bacterium]